MAAIRTPAGIGLAYVAGVAMVAVAPVGDAVIVVACAIRLKHRPAALVDIGLRCVGIAGTIADSLAHLRTPGFDLGRTDLGLVGRAVADTLLHLRAVDIDLGGRGIASRLAVTIEGRALGVTLDLLGAHRTGLRPFLAGLRP